MGLTFRTGALVDAIYTDSSNKVGIGTSTLTAGIPLSINVATGNNCNVAFQENASDKWYLRNITSSNAFSFYSVAGGAEVMRLSSSGNVGIGTPSVTNKLTIVGSETGTQITTVPIGKFVNTGNSFSKLIVGSDNANYDAVISMDNNATLANTKLRFYIGNGTNSTAGHSNDQIVLQGNGNVGIGTGSPATLFHLNSPASTNCTIYFGVNGTMNGYLGQAASAGSLSSGAAVGDVVLRSQTNLLFTSGGDTERMRINSDGRIIKAANNTQTGQFQIGGQTGSPPNAILVSAADENGPYPIGIKALSATPSQGLFGFFDSANATQGSITINGSSVSYNSFMGSHWSQLQDNSKPEILKGTILEAIDELCTWDGETNDRLAKVKISDIADSKNVYGVFLGWDNMDDYNDMYVAALGAGYIRVNQNEVVSMGDLLQSNGDGTAKVQSDDIMRSSTIAKVVSTQKIETYADGSYLIAATLHCG